MVAVLLTSIAGSSDVFDCGFVTYSNEAKTGMLGVSPEVIANFGAVSRECALAMAHGAILKSAATLSISVTGIAGPGGGSASKPVGLVHFACARKNGPTLHREERFGDIGRGGVRGASVEVALDLLQAQLL
jgi:nicotinamide-nucleotide amidase